MTAFGNYCWEMLSFQNISDESLMNVAAASAIVVAALHAVRIKPGATPSSSLVLVAVDQLSRTLVPVFTCSAIASGLLYSCKAVAKPQLRVLVERSSRIFRNSLPQMVTLLSLIVAVFVWKTRRNLKNMEWIVRIWASTRFGRSE